MNKLHETDPCDTLKKTKKENEVKRCILTLSHFLAEVMYLLHRI